MKARHGTVMFILACCFTALNSGAQTQGLTGDTLKNNTFSVRPSSDTVKKIRHTAPVPKPKGLKPITHEISGGLRLNSNGWSIYGDLGKVVTKDVRHIDMFHNVRFWQLEFSEKKDPKEYKSTSTLNGGGNSYIYGKINNMYAVKLGWGFRKMLVGKPDPGSVSIHWVNAGGLSLGLVKPYYINTISDPNAIKYADGYKETFLDQQLIEGNAGFSKGLSEMKIVPGGHFKSAMHFDFSANRKSVIGVETGFNVEYYSQQIQLMANEAPTSYFMDIFIAIQFGKRW
jgi:hypothetical protein